MGSTSNYPSHFSIQDKLFACYSLIGELSRKKLAFDREFLKGRYPAGQWRSFCEWCDSLLLPLLIEQNSLKDSIRRASYTEDQWEKLPLLGKDAFVDSNYGSRQALGKLPTVATSPLLDALNAVDILQLPSSPTRPDPTQNFLTYTEVDGAGYLTVTAPSIVGANISNTAAYVYSDKGSNHFNGIDFFATIQYVNQVGVETLAGGPGLTVSHIGSIDGYGATDLSVICRCPAGTLYRMYLGRGAGIAADFWELNGIYWTKYIRLERSTGGDTSTVKIYPTLIDRSNDTNRDDTLSVSGFGVAKWRYCYGFNTWVAVGNISATVSDLDLREKPFANMPARLKAGGLL